MLHGSWVPLASAPITSPERRPILTVLQGSAKDAVSGVAVHRTKLAAAYPPALCDRLLQLATEAAS